MQSNWTTTTLGNCCNFLSGGTPRKAVAEYWTGTIPWISGKDLKSFYLSDAEDHITAEGAEAGSRIVPAGTILLLVRGMTLHNSVPVAVLTREAAFNQDIKAIRAKEHVDQQFLSHWLVAARPKLLATVHAAGHGTGVLATDRLKALELDLPPLAEQRRIAEVFGQLEDKIEQNRRTGSKLEGLARAVFKAWFVDFEPVKAKAAGATAFPGMPPETFATLPTRLTDSEIGPVPEGWEVKPIGDVVTVRGGGTPSTKDDSFWTGGTHYWATPKDLSSLQHPILLSTERRITDAGVAKISSGVLPVNTVLLSSRAPVGYLALAKVPTAVNQGFIAIECTGPLKPHFMLQWLNARMDEIKGRASGTTFAEISKSAFRQIPAAVPIPAMASAFEDIAKPLFDMITHLVAESAKLAALRDYLLPRLLSGRVRVGERMSPRQLTSNRP